MQKLKPLLPTLRENKRYLVYEVETKEKGDLSSEIISQTKLLLGIFDSAKAGLQNVEYNKNSKKGMLRTSTKSLDKVRSALSLISSLRGKESSIRVLTVSGTMKSARLKIKKE